jgi:hypothetical protein
MSEQSLPKKLKIKPSQKALILNAPPGYLQKILPLPEGVTVAERNQGPFDFIQIFVQNKKELDKLAPVAIRSLNPNGIFWISYPKGTSKIKTDLGRDEGWDILKKLGLQCVSLISIDETWTGVYCKPKSEDTSVKKKSIAQDGMDLDGVKYVDKEKRIVNLPPDLFKKIHKNKIAMENFEKLSFTNRKEYVSWIIAAKKEETRNARIINTVKKLEKGLKNPADKG